MIALSKGTSKYSLNLSQDDGATGAEGAEAETTGAASTGVAAPGVAAPGAASPEVDILLSIYRDS